MVKKTTKKTASKSSKVKGSMVQKQTGIDLIAAVLVISLLFNLFAVCVWITLRITDAYDVQLSQLLLAR